MPKHLYKVAVVRKDRESDYHDFWNKNLKINSRGDALDSEVVGIYRHIEAKNLNDAIAIVQKEFPGLTIAREHCAKQG